MTENGAIAWANERRKLRDLIPWDHNPREINKREAERLGDSLVEFGQIQTIAIGPDNEVYDGHQRKLVWSILPQFGRDYEVDVRVSSRPLTEHERQKLVVYLHKGTTGEWDWTELANSFELSDLTEWGFEEGELIGWPQEEPAEDPGAQLDKAAKLQEKWGVAKGDVWQCGDHFVICGDCREPEVWTRLLGIAGVDKVNGVFTSPPYAEQRKKQYGGVPVDEYVEWWDAVQENVRANLADDGSFFVNIKPHSLDGQRSLYVLDLVSAMARQWAWCLIDEYAWVSQGTPGEWKNKFKNAFEPIYHFARQVDIAFSPRNVLIDPQTDLGKLEEYGGRNSKWKSASGSSYRGHGVKSQKYSGKVLPSNVIEVASVSSQGHSGAFPVELPAFCSLACSDPADAWIDPFLGSGTTIVAAHQNERRGLGIEQLEKYVSVTLERLAGMGLEPQRVTQ